ncbi:MAG: DnaJ domain-containing protein [Candidatus Riflebacteria bacterium]|nr:DnaJ domain-containing protein [Candidatus Riflebacteria bacterium]
MDPYQTLGVSPTATDEEIKCAYRKLSKEYHPDVNLGKAGTESKFKEINAAYQLIKTEALREKYKQDQFFGVSQGQTGRSGPFYRETQTSESRYSHAHADDFEDILGSFFRGRKQSGHIDIPGEDYSFTLEIDLRDAVMGAEKEIRLQPGKSTLVKIPPGTDTGTKLKLQGQGGPGFGNGQPGDAYIEIRVRSSDVFRREGANFFIEVPVTIDEVVNGTEIEVPTVEGPVKMKIPPAMDTAKKLCLRNKGFPGKDNKTRGNLLVELKVIMPKLQDQQFKDFIREWTRKNPYQVRMPNDLKGGQG